MPRKKQSPWSASVVGKSNKTSLPTPSSPQPDINNQTTRKRKEVCDRNSPAPKRGRKTSTKDNDCELPLVIQTVQDIEPSSDKLPKKRYNMVKACPGCKAKLGRNKYRHFCKPQPCYLCDKTLSRPDKYVDHVWNLHKVKIRVENFPFRVFPLSAPKEGHQKEADKIPKCAKIKGNQNKNCIKSVSSAEGPLQSCQLPSVDCPLTFTPSSSQENQLQHSLLILDLQEKLKEANAKLLEKDEIIQKLKQSNGHEKTTVIDDDAALSESDGMDSESGENEGPELCDEITLSQESQDSTLFSSSGMEFDKPTENDELCVPTPVREESISPPPTIPISDRDEDNYEKSTATSETPATSSELDEASTHPMKGHMMKHHHYNNPPECLEIIDDTITMIPDEKQFQIEPTVSEERISSPQDICIPFSPPNTPCLPRIKCANSFVYDQTIEAFEGEAIAIRMSISGKPPIANTWFKDGMQLKFALATTEGNGLVLEDCSDGSWTAVSMVKAHKTLGGSYGLRSSNLHGSHFMEVNLVVSSGDNQVQRQQQPEERTLMRLDGSLLKDLLFVCRGQRLYITVPIIKSKHDVYAYNPFKVEWTLNGKTVSDKVTSVDGTGADLQASIDIARADKCDGGLYVVRLLLDEKLLSSVSTTVKILKAPSRPQNIKVGSFIEQPGKKFSCLLSWTAPLDDGGAPIQKYQICQIMPDKTVLSDAPCYNEKLFGWPTETYFLIEGLPLQFQTRFKFSVSAYSGVHLSLPTTINFRFPDSASIPETPTDLKIDHDDGVNVVVLSWNIPKDNGAEITSYIVLKRDILDVAGSYGNCGIFRSWEVSSNGKRCRVKVKDLSATQSKYAFTVKATNRKGTSGRSFPSTCIELLGNSKHH